MDSFDSTLQNKQKYTRKAYSRNTVVGIPLKGSYSKTHSRALSYKQFMEDSTTPFSGVRVSTGANGAVTNGGTSGCAGGNKGQVSNLKSYPRR